LIDAMNKSGDYSPHYFDSIRGRSHDSAGIVAPLVAQLTRPISVVDVGCGTGAWAAAFKKLGVSDVLGIDGEYCDRAGLEISPEEFLPADVTQPLELRRSFDLAVCLEVAEHLEPQHAEQLIANLTSLAPVVLFSAAVPEQGGEHHVNEQWPDYWIQRFDSRGYAAYDPFRAQLWENYRVAWWYSQNLLLFVNRQAIPSFERLHRDAPTFAALPVVHPQLTDQLGWQNKTLRAAIELMTITPPQSRVLLLDEARLAAMPPIDRALNQFPDDAGAYVGPPADSTAAILAIEAKRAEGFAYLAVAWPAFWWLDFYEEFAWYLRIRCDELSRSELLIVYRLS
jgi:SAM-dependent methyltransferase